MIDPKGAHPGHVTTAVERLFALFEAMERHAVEASNLMADGSFLAAAVALAHATIDAQEARNSCVAIGHVGDLAQTLAFAIRSAAKDHRDECPL